MPPRGCTPKAGMRLCSTLPEYQCRVHPVDYVPSFFNIRVWEERDKDSQELIAFHVHHQAWGTERTIWMDGRPHPPDYALHTSQGFSTGKWDGEILTVTTTHLKQGWIRRNGIPRSDRAIVYENFIRHGDHLTWTTVIHDPAYLTETFIRTRDFLLSIGLQMGAYPCESVVEVVMPKGKIPHHLPGTNTFLAEFPARYGIPAEAAMGGAETMYPEYQQKLKTMPKPEKKARERSPENVFTCMALGICMAAACAAGIRTSQAEIHVLPAQGNVYMLVGPGGNR